MANIILEEACVKGKRHLLTMCVCNTAVLYLKYLLWNYHFSHTQIYAYVVSESSKPSEQMLYNQ